MHARLSYLLKIHVDIIPSSTLRSYKLFLSLEFPHQHSVSVYPPFPFNTCLIPRLSLSLEFPHQNSIRIFPRIPPHKHMPHASLISTSCTIIIFDEERIMKHFLRFFPVPCFFLPRKPRYLSQHPAVQHPRPVFCPHCEIPIFTPIGNNRQNYSWVFCG